MSAGAIGFIGGLMGGYIREKRARGVDDRAERGMQIHEGVEGRKAFWDQQQRDWREYMETRPTPDGKSQWDQFWEDPNAMPDGPMSPIGEPQQPQTPAGTMEDQGPAMEGEAPMGSGAPGDPAMGQTGGGGGGAAPLGAAAPDGAIPVAPPMQASNVATPAWNRIGAAEGGRISVSSGGQHKLWEGAPQEDNNPVGALTGTPQMSPIGTEGLLPDLERQAQEEEMLARQRQFAEGAAAAQGWADQQPGMQPIERNPSQMRLRGAGPVQGAIDVRRSDPRMVQPQQHQWGRAAEGGPVEVMARFAEGGMAEVPQQGAIPAEGIGEITPGPAPQQSPAAPERVPSRYRDRLAAWQRQAENHAMMAGGLETLTKFREMENATSRRAVMGYGLDAIRSLDEGNVGDAMRSGNSALESTPFDTGIKFEASEGELYMVGSDGQRGEALTANHLRAFVEDNMKTPETYLEWKKQVETERSALVDERTAAKTAESGRISAEAQAEVASYAGQRADAGTATALAAVIGSLSRRDAAAHARAEELGWDASESIRVIQLANDFFMNEWRPLTPEVGDWFGDHPEAEGKFKSDVSQLMLEQGPGRGGRNTLDPDKAAIISQLIRQPGGIDLSATHPDFRVQRNKETGEMVAVYDGQTFRIPQGMYADAMKNFKLVGGEADPDATTSQTGALPAWQQSALDMQAEEEAQAQSEAILKQQQEDQYRQATHG